MSTVVTCVYQFNNQEEADRFQGFIAAAMRNEQAKNGNTIIACAQYDAMQLLEKYKAFTACLLNVSQERVEAWYEENVSKAEDQPAEQHQGEPVAWRVTGPSGVMGCYIQKPHGWAHGYKIEPLYTHADPGEVERLRKELGNTQALLDQANYHKAQRGETIDALRTQLAEARKYIEFVEAESEFRKSQLAERDALLRKVREPLDLRAEFDPTYPENTVPRNDCAEAVKAIDTALSANAESPISKE